MDTGVNSPGSLAAQAGREGKYKIALGNKGCKISCFCICSAINRGNVK